ncbi:hypothetical protein EVA_10504 [gut metagenome]|uniref:Uncharacterized protein n=1 Tax=gut metagenome TaxID=749906 RepID=J9G3G3_9ZZZZ
MYSLTSFFRLFSSRVHGSGGVCSTSSRIACSKAVMSFHSE